MKLAIIGGGFTGKFVAYQIFKNTPNIEITIIDKVPTESTMLPASAVGPLGLEVQSGQAWNCFADNTDFESDNGKISQMKIDKQSQTWLKAFSDTVNDQKLRWLSKI